MYRLLLLLIAWTSLPAADFWASRVPARTAALKSPYIGEETAVHAGAKLYHQHCAACHGAERGGASHVPAIGSSLLQHLTDGQLFWILTNGRLKNGMPSWSHLPPQQ